MIVDLIGSFRVPGRMIGFLLSGSGFVSSLSGLHFHQSLSSSRGDFPSIDYCACLWSHGPLWRSFPVAGSRKIQSMKPEHELVCDPLL